MTAPTVALTGPMLKVTLNGLGLSPNWFAKRMGVTMRTVVRWFDGDKIPSKVTSEIDSLCERTVDEMRTMVDETSADEDGHVTLRTYRTDEEFRDPEWPASWHRMLTFRVMEHFRAQGNTVSVEYR